MPRRQAAITQSEIARAVRAARKAGATAVEIRADGTLIVRFDIPDESRRVDEDVRF